MYARTNLDSVPLGRRVIERLSGGRCRLAPGIVPEIVSWLRMIGNTYIAILTGIQQSHRSQSDAYINAMKQTTEYRIGLIQDLINCTMDTFSRHNYLGAFADTCRELGIDERDLDESLLNPQETYTEGSGI
jgi:hypothetical protein